MSLVHLLGLAGPETPVCNELDVVLTIDSLRWVQTEQEELEVQTVGTMGLSWDKAALSPMLNVAGGYCCNLRKGTGFFFLSLVCNVSIVLETKAG